MTFSEEIEARSRLSETYFLCCVVSLSCPIRLTSYQDKFLTLISRLTNSGSLTGNASEALVCLVW